MKAETPGNPQLLESALRKVAALYDSRPDYTVGVDGLRQIVESGFSTNPILATFFNNFSRRVKDNPPFAQGIAENLIGRFDQAKQANSIYEMRATLATAQAIGLYSHDEFSREFESRRRSLESTQEIKDPGRRKFLKGTFMGATALATSMVLKDKNRSLTKPNQELESEPVSILDEFLKPFVTEALRKRQERAKSDPEYSKRVDQELNQDIITFVVFSYGNNHEPPNLEKGYTGSYAIVSYNFKTKTFNEIAITHDTRTPEIERFLQQRGIKTNPAKIDKAYRTGGFELMRQSLEDATGLSVDFQIAFPDSFLKSLIDETIGRLNVDVPYDINLIDFYVDDTKYPGVSIKEGVHDFDGIMVMQYIKALDENYDRVKEKHRHIRKRLIMESLYKQFAKHLWNPLFIGRMLTFTTKTLFNKTVDLDFNKNILFGSLNGIFNAVSSMFTHHKSQQNPVENNQNGFIKYDHRLFIGDSVNTDGGLQWATANKEVNQTTKKDFERGAYDEEPALVLPTDNDANPYAEDLVKDYWGSVRRLVKKTFLRQ